MSVTGAPGRALPTPSTGITAEDRASRWVLAAVRIGVAFLWITNEAWKIPPGFGALRFFTRQAVLHPVFPPYSWVVRVLILPHFTPFAWLVLVLEAALGGFLLIGLATRFWALVGFAQTLAIMFSVLALRNEWPWAYILMAAVHLALFAAAAGRAGGLDGVLRPRWATSDGRLARALMRAS